MDAKRQPLAWEDLRLLLAVARSGSFLAAGRDLDAATSTVSRRLSRLEAAVGTALVERRSDGVRLTAAGRELAASAEDFELRLAARLRELPQRAGGLRGTIRVTSGDGFAEFLVAAVASFVERHPAVSFEIAIESRAVDLARREADVALRTVQRREGSLIYRPLGTLAYGLWAAPAYAARHGLPRGVADLAAHAFVGFAPPLERLPVVRWLRAHGAARFPVRATTFGALLAAVRAGLGIGALPAILAGGLAPVLPRTRPEPLAVHLVVHPEARRLPHVRAFCDLIAERFRELAR